MNAPEFLIVGRVRKVHGLHGELVVEPITDAPDAVFASGRRVFAGTADGDLAADRQELHVRSARPFKGGYIVAFREIGDRTTADPWRGRFLLAPRDELPPPAEGEVYQHELLGLRVELPSGEVVGTVEQLYELPQGLVVDVRRTTGGTVMIPYRDGIVVRVDVPGGVLVVAPPVGLLE
jgi:16S rRNA processing protein RimM